jgi:5-methylcytosine-specific restriction endonuclease McrA
MEYRIIYESLINRAKVRHLDGYSELHHIVPKCIGGNDELSNLVALTAREHFIAHLLLAKIHGGKLWHAAHMMSNMKKYSNRTYAIAKQNHSKLLSEQNVKLKSKPKELRLYTCKLCGNIFEKLEFTHHVVRDIALCSQRCAAQYNGKMNKSHVSRNKGSTAWNKGQPNPNSVDNARKGAAKLSQKAIGRTRLYREDGSWTWQYSKE